MEGDGMTLGGLRLQAKTIHMFFVVDVSGSMASDAKIQSLNAALEEVLPSLRREAEELVGINPQVRVLTFESTAAWRRAEPVPLHDFWWEEVVSQEQGLTELGSAIHFLCAAMDSETHSVPPAIVLLTDGMPTDTVAPSFAEALNLIDNHPIGRASSRAAIAIGKDADRTALEAFVAKSNGSVLSADRPQQLTEVIRVAGSSVLRSASELNG